MRRHVKVFANFLGATKELTTEYAALANITEDELNQIRLTVASRPDRRETAKLLASKGMSTRQIAEITGWHHSTIAEDLRVGKPTKTVGNPTGDFKTGSAKPKTERDAKNERAAEVAATAAKDGTTPEPSFDEFEKEKYRIVYADPPWSYSATMPAGEAYDHYPVMETTAICALPVEQWVEDNAVLFLWATSPILEEAFQVLKAWGFTYKAQFIWDKIKHNMGHYNSVRHELLLICTRGSCQPDVKQLIDSVQSIERSDKHSQKPVEFYDIIETLYTHGRRLELFHRGEVREGWDCTGLESDSNLQEAAE